MFNPINSNINSREKFEIIENKVVKNQWIIPFIDELKHKAFMHNSELGGQS